MRRALRILGGILDNHPGFDPATKPPLYFFTDYKAFSLDISVTLWFQTLDFVQFQKWKQEINLCNPRTVQCCRAGILPSRPAPIILSHKTTPHKQVKEQW